MIDRSVPYYPVLMMKSDMPNIPQFNLPQGYYFSYYTEKSGKSDWVEVQKNAHQIENPDELPALFEREFPGSPASLKERMLFVRDAEGTPVATATLWLGTPFGQELERIHWVATDDAHQGKGLCRALLCKLLTDAAERIGNTEVCLYTGTVNYAAIGVYQKMGFQPWTGEPYRDAPASYPEKNALMWQMIEEKIAEHHRG